MGDDGTSGYIEYLNECVTSCFVGAARELTLFVIKNWS
jgi:hypothetical protein